MTVNVSCLPLAAAGVCAQVDDQCIARAIAQQHVTKDLFGNDVVTFIVVITLRRDD